MRTHVALLYMNAAEVRRLTRANEVTFARRLPVGVNASDRCALSPLVPRNLQVSADQVRYRFDQLTCGFSLDPVFQRDMMKTFSVFIWLLGRVFVKTNVIATNRFGLGARPGEIAHVSSDPREWLLAQVRGSRALPEPIATLTNSADLFRIGQRARMERNQTRDEKTAGQDARKISAVRQTLAPVFLEQVAARYRVAVSSRESFRERLVHFWCNHFAVSADKPQVAILAAALENEAIRPNIDNTFTGLLVAVESHPAMILYLDNQASVGRHSTVAQRAARRAPDSDRKLDLNENLSREVLELHTLGVGSGYTQTDVTAFARVLTGWSVGSDRGHAPSGESGNFVFRANAHEPGAQTLLGKRYSEDGVQQARAVLHDLAVHHATATHVATKLVRHFINDEPPADAVQTLRNVFIETAGDLPSVHAALVALPQAWTVLPVKYKTPHEFVISTFRTFDSVPSASQQILAPLQLLGQRPYTPGSPAGWPDTAAQWDGPDALLKRIEWASQYGERVGTRARPLQLADVAFGDQLSDRTRTAISRAASAAQGVTLLLTSPEFLRR